MNRSLLVDVGSGALGLALVTSLFAVVMAILAAQGRSETLLVATTRAVRATFGLMALVAVGIWTAFLTNRFDLEYVASYSSRELPFAYKIAALWGGQKGSLVLWALILSIYAVLVVRPKKSTEPVLLAVVAAVLMGVLTFFLALANFSTNPFERVAGEAAVDGRGLNPLLQHPAMAIHPPALYTGFVGMSVPYAFLMASLLLGRSDDRWIRLSRKATLIAWSALFFGNLLGMAWAYMELGWGGYWAWDPVENAACMPLLTGTAFLHSVMIQERRGMLKVWNASLVSITFLLTIFGTFLTRSGVVSSVHSFGDSTLGAYFLVFLAVCVAFTAATMVARRKQLRSEHHLDSIWSREAAFIINNIVFVGAAFSILWGTTYPILSEAVSGVKATVGAPFFNRVNVPIAIVLLLLTGIGPLIAWRKASLDQLRRSFLLPLGAGALMSIGLYFLGVTKLYALMVFGISMFVLTTIGVEITRGVRARRSKHGEAAPVALVNLVLRNPRRYGGYAVHLGVLLFFVGVAASSAYRIQTEALLSVGGEMKAGPYKLRLDRLDLVETTRSTGASVSMSVWRGARSIGVVQSEKVTYRTGIRQEEQPTTNVGIRSTPVDDLYIVPAEYDPQSKQVHLKVFVNPMVLWIWMGGALVLLGTAIALVPTRQLVPATALDMAHRAVAPTHGPSQMAHGSVLRGAR